MSVRILIGREQGDRYNDSAVLFDSVTGWAFGPIFSEGEDGEPSAEDRAQAFLDWLRENDGRDARRLTPGELERRYVQWLRPVDA